MELHETIEVPVPQEEAFAYVADFSTTADWDPSITRAERVDEGPVGKGSEFRLMIVFGGREMMMRYVIIEHDPPSRLVLEGEGATVNATDAVSFSPTSAGTLIDWRVDLRFRSLMRFLEPVLRIPLQRSAKRSMVGLRRALSR